MTYAMGVRKVKDFAQWKRAFDEGAAIRKAGGMREYHIFQVVGDPNTILVMVSFDSPEAATKFMQSADLRQADEHSGVIATLATFDTSQLLTEADSGHCA